MIVSPICEMLGIKYPIFQGGMAWIADGKLAAAVSNGGGLGIISAMNAGGDYLREQIRIARSLTDKPFGVNIMLMSPHVQEVAKIVAEEKVAVVTTGAGIPNQYVPMWKEAGIKVIPVAASVAAAKMMARAGADAVIAEGGESGGHIGEQTTMTLVPQVVDAVSIPVIAAGGIGDGRGIAAAFMLGAEAVQIGTRFVVSDESIVHENYKQRIIKAIINKLISANGLTKVNDLMDIAPNYIITNMPAEKIADFVSGELNELKPWTISSITSDNGVYEDLYVASLDPSLGVSNVYLFSRDEVHAVVNAYDAARRQLQMNSFTFNLYANTPKINTSENIRYADMAENPQ